MEQYGRKLCIRIGVVPTVDNEALDGVLDKVKSLIKETSHDIPDAVIDTAQRTRKDCNDKKNPTYFVKVLLYVFHFLGTRQCFIGVEIS